MHFRPLILATAAAAALAATPALADSVTVQYDDLNLSNAQDQATLRSRIETAAREVCGIGEVRTGTRIRSAAARKCYQSALADINRQFAGLLERQHEGG
jgi:UrcA family protein